MKGFRIAVWPIVTIGVWGCSGSQPTPDPEPVPTPTTEVTDVCAPVGDIQFICNLISPEDLAVIPDSDWLIASGNQEGGMLHLVTVSYTHLTLPTSDLV